MQLKKYPRSQQRLDLLARICADALELAAAFANENGLLSGAFTIDRSRDARKRILCIWLRLIEALDHYRRGVRDFFACFLQNALRINSATRKRSGWSVY